MRKRVPNTFLSVSATTRKERGQEDSGSEYHFLKREDFEKRINNEQFLEWANIYGDLYGTPKEPIEKALAEKKLAILEIDVQGAEQLRKSLGQNAAFVFIAPPSMDALKERLTGRKTESDKSIEMRLKVARDELKHIDKYDYILLNDDLEKATQNLCEIISKIKKEV